MIWWKPEVGKVKKNNITNPITEGVIWKQLLIFFFPIVIGTLVQQLYNTVDAIIVGRFVGKEALASVGGSASVLSLIHILCWYHSQGKKNFG